MLVWLWLLLVTATLAGFFGGYFHKNLEFGKRFSAFIAGVAGLSVFASFALAAPRPELWVGAGLLAWMSFLVLGFYLGGKLRKSHEAGDPFAQRISS